MRTPPAITSLLVADLLAEEERNQLRVVEFAAGLADVMASRYVLVVAFLRGSTNPPPDDYFVRAETWVKQVREEGIVVTVPAEAQQTLLFLAPVTGGDFNTLRATVKARPESSLIKAAHGTTNRTSVLLPTVNTRLPVLVLPNWWLLNHRWLRLLAVDRSWWISEVTVKSV